MEEEFWNALRDIAADRDTTLSVLIKEIVGTIDRKPGRCQTASVFRTYVLEHYLNLPTKQRATTRGAYRNTVRPQLH
ncbi:MAG: ribbon-helix-helix domain-containing protein [Xanthobacteraceae bacterium]